MVALRLHVISFSVPARLQSFIGARNRADELAHRMGQAGVRIDAEQLVHGADQIARIDGPILDLLALGIGGADHLSALESTAGHDVEKTLP